MISVKNFYFKSKKLNKNLKITKKIFKSFLSDFKKFNLPLELKAFEKDNKLDFSPMIIKKFSRYENIIILGMGGSILGTKCIYSFFKAKIKKKVFFFDNLDSNLFLEFKKIKNLKNSCFVVVSKSGETLETITNLSVIFSKKLFKKKLVVITEIKDNSLINIANKFNAEIIEHKDFLGGRYSVLSEVGMFPAALMGLDIKKFSNVKKLLQNKLFVSTLIKNVANIYTFYKKGINNSIVLNYDADLNNLGYWYQQLVAESLGKKGKGITPIISPSPKDHHSMLQLYLDGPKNKFYTFLCFANKKNKNKISGNFLPKKMQFLKSKNVASIVKAQQEATASIFKLKKMPYREFFFKKENESELGEIFTFFVLETILLGRLLNINVFNQPAVEQIKIETKKILSI